MTALAVENLHVRLAERHILRGLDLTLAPGTLAALVGPNGAGKTTLLRAILGLAPPAQGQILLDGKPARRLAPDARARALAYLPQRPAVYWPIPVAELVQLGRIPHRPSFARPRTADRQAVRRALAATGLVPLARRPFPTLSGGEQARALLARALAVESSFLLADEPVASLDPYHQIEVMELLQNAARRGTGILAVLHDLTLAARFCPRLILMNQGRIIADGPPQEILSSGKIAAAYRIEIHQGRHDGQLFIIPWRRRAADPTAAARPERREEQSAP